MQVIIIIIFILLLCGALYFWQMSKNSTHKPLEGKITKANINDLKMNKVVHDKLSDEQIKRITNFKEILKEVDVTPIEETMTNFQRDTNPDREIAVWENIAKAYRNVNSENQNLSTENKKEVYALLLYRSMMPKEEVLQQLKLKSISPEKADAFISYYDR